MRWSRWPLALAVAAGLALACWAIGRVGVGDLARAVARLGVGGFVLLCAITGVTLVMLGAAQLAAMRGARRGWLPLFAWARAARDASADLLPFSQVGGLLVGARTLVGAGLPPARVYAAMIVDLTTEMAGQLVVTLFGLWALVTVLIEGGGHAVSAAAWGGAALAVATLAGFVLLQRPLLSLADRIAARVLPDRRLPMAEIRAELDRLYADRRPVAWSFLFNLLAWTLTAALAWLTLGLMGAEVSPLRAMALESLVTVVRSAAFMIPGAIGVQEAAYLLLAQAFGIDPQAAVALSLVKRARDVAIGVPTLLVWQANEWRLGLRAAG